MTSVYPAPTGPTLVVSFGSLPTITAASLVGVDASGVTGTSSLASVVADTASGVTLTAGAYTTVLADLTKLLDVTTGASDATITLLGAVAAGADAVQMVRKLDTGAGRVVVIYANGPPVILARPNEIAVMRSNGTVWVPELWRGASGILVRSAVAIPNTASTTTENVLATITLPANILGTDGGVIIDTLWSCTNNANVKTGRARLGGIGGTIVGSISLANSASGRHLGKFANRGAANSQVFFLGGSGSGTSSAAIGTASIDTTASQDIVITAQNATGSDTTTLEAYRVELVA